MVNKTGGKKHKRGKGVHDTVRELQFKEDSEEYGLVTKMLGCGNVQAKMPDGNLIIAHIRGAFRNRVRIEVGDLVLLCIRDFQKEKADIINKYTADEHRMLKSYGELSFDEPKDSNANKDSEVVDVEFLDVDSI